jgi:hypothetical protein
VDPLEGIAPRAGLADPDGLLPAAANKSNAAGELVREAELMFVMFEDVGL